MWAEVDALMMDEPQGVRSGARLVSGPEIRKMRDDYGVTQGELAEHLCVSRGTVSNRERQAALRPEVVEAHRVAILAIHKQKTAPYGRGG